MAYIHGEKVDLSVFKKSIENMITTSIKSYNRFGYHKGERIGSYTKDELLRIINDGDPEELRRASNFFFYTSGFYRRFITYYATLLKYSYLLIPHTVGAKEIDNKKNMDSYNMALDFIGKLNLRPLSRHIALQVLKEGAYYGVFREVEKDVFAIQDLPANYCRNRFKNQDGISTVELNLRYFDTITDKTRRIKVLKSFGKATEKAYIAYKSGKSEDWWYMFEPEQSLYFTIADERPFFSSILPAVIDFNEYREIEKKKDMQDLKSILVQELPIEDGELVIDPEEAEKIHDGSVEMLKNNTNTDVLTTYAKARIETMESNRSVVTNNLEKIEKSIYSEAGVSKQLFSAEGNVALKYSITNDTTLMMILSSQIANWVQYLVNLRFRNKSLSFKVASLPFSYYNETDMRKDCIQMAQSGYSFLLAWLTFDLDQADLSDLKKLEVNALKLNELMIPLASSYTTSSGNPTDTTEVNKKDDGEITEKTVQNKNAGAGADGGA